MKVEPAHRSDIFFMCPSISWIEWFGWLLGTSILFRKSVAFFFINVRYRKVFY